MRRFVIAIAILVVLPLTAIQSSEAQNFSVESGSLDTGGFPPPGDDILLPGPFPVLFGGGFGIDVDGFTYGFHTKFDTPAFDFSVDGFSVGLPGTAVETEFLAGLPGMGEQNYDIYRTFVTSIGTNLQIHDGNGALPGGLAMPALGMAEPQFGVSANPFGTGVDGYDSRPMPPMSPVGPGPIYWSWDPFSGGAASASAADVLLSAAIPGFTGASAVFASEAMLGLMPGDNIDALEVLDLGTMGVFDPGVDAILFSLDPLSPTLIAGGFSAADILFSDGVSPISPFLLASDLGLFSSDNVTAFSAVAIPEPNSLLILLVAFGAAGLKRRKRN